jgi:hypothetical protein
MGWDRETVGAARNVDSRSCMIYPVSMLADVTIAHDRARRITGGNMRWTIVALSIATACLALSAPVSAQTLRARAWVSAAKGANTSGCGATASPCLTFQYALGQAAANGEIDVMDPGGYGPVVIDKAIAIVNDGVGAATITGAAKGNAITINAGIDDRVILRGCFENRCGGVSRRLAL